MITCLQLLRYRAPLANSLMLVLDANHIYYRIFLDVELVTPVSH